MFVIAGASGNTGSVLVKTLLEHKQPVRVLLRNEAKAAAFRSHGADVAMAEVDNAEALTAALKGASGAYVLLPPDLSSADPIGRGRRIAEAIAVAVERSGVPHVTLLSSVGADLESGNGIVRTLHIAEQRLAQIGMGLTCLRAGYFMENWASSFGMAMQSGTLYTFLSPVDRKIPMVATQDIGLMAAYSLMFPTRSTRIIELAGPEDYSPNDAAAMLSRASGKTIGIGVAPLAGMVPMLTQFGMHEASATEMAGLTAAINEGRITFGQPGGQLVRGTTSLEKAFVGMLRAPGTAAA